MVRAIQGDDQPLSRLDSWFTPVSATETLPLVRRIVAELLELHRTIKTQRTQIRGIDALAGLSDRPDYQEEIRDIRQSLGEDEARFEASMKELTAIGVVPHVPFDGKVDFPAIVNRRPVMLCWTPPETVVDHWHEIDSPSDRHAVDPNLFATGSVH